MDKNLNLIKNNSDKVKLVYINVYQLRWKKPKGFSGIERQLYGINFIKECNNYSLNMLEQNF